MDRRDAHLFVCAEESSGGVVGLQELSAVTLNNIIKYIYTNEVVSVRVQERGRAIEFRGCQLEIQVVDLSVHALFVPMDGLDFGLDLSATHRGWPPPKIESRGCQSLKKRGVFCRF